MVDLISLYFVFLIVVVLTALATGVAKVLYDSVRPTCSVCNKKFTVFRWHYTNFIHKCRYSYDDPIIYAPVCGKTECQFQRSVHYKVAIKTRYKKLES